MATDPVPASPIEPPRLDAGPVVLRAYTADEVPALPGLCSDPEVQRWTMMPAPYTAEDARDFVELIAPQAAASGTGLHLAVVDATTDVLLGGVGLGGIRGRIVQGRLVQGRIVQGRKGDGGHGGASVGFWLAPAARGRGIATAAVSEICRYGFGTLGLARLDWRALTGNWASRAVATRCGFRYEGLRRGGADQRGVRQDEWTAGLLPEDGPPPPLPVLVDGPTTLRPLRGSDVPQLLAVVDEEVLRWTGYPSPFDEAAAWMLVHRAAASTHDTGTFTVEVNGELAGGVSAHLDERGIATLGWWLAAAHRRRGHAARAVRLILDWAVERGATRVEAVVVPGNQRSLSVARGLGMTAEGLRRGGCRQRSALVDGEVLALLPGDAGWPTGRGS